MNNVEQKHAEMVALLSKDGQKIIDELTPQSAHLWHMATGVVNEIFELKRAVANDDHENIVEELGDLEFFLEGIRGSLGIERSVIIDTKILGEDCDILDVVKKMAIYLKPLDFKTLRVSMAQIEYYMNCIRKLYSIDRADTLAANYDKLMKKRYPNGYSNHAAQDRADK